MTERPIDHGRCTAFVEAIINVCRSYNIVLGHEDEHGAFELWDYQDCDREACEQWLRDAHRGHKPYSHDLRKEPQE